MKTTIIQKSETQALFQITFGLAIFTIVYNLIEGLISTFFGYQDESLALFGFGVDSFIEVVSGLGIAQMILRIWQNQQSNRNRFEKTALKITGFAFYALVVGLSATSFYTIWTAQKPETTFWGVVISLISIVVMWALVLGKKYVGKKLNSEAVLADAECTKVCIYMSVILLISSGVYALTLFPYIDSLGTLGLAYLSFKEGNECFEKAKSEKYCACGHD